MSSFATLPTAERRLLIEQVAVRQNVAPLIIEKDFWVCWSLSRIFATGSLVPHVVFKGGTSLAKVFAVIDRFSEDIDLSVSPASLGMTELELDDAPSTSQRAKRMKTLAARCETWVRDTFQPEFEAAIGVVLGPAARGVRRLRFEIDPVAGTPNLWFAYPSVLPQPGGYIAKQVKLEFGALTRQQPTNEYSIAPMLAATLGASYDDFTSPVVALEITRTFWEKATILHAEYFRPSEKPLREHFARHYADFAALWRHDARAQCLLRLDLLEDVVRHKSHFFASAWASYDTARLGSFHLVPPEHRHAALARDYAAMQPMFLRDQPSFEALFAELKRAEDVLNDGLRL
jgi:Nucleotidyl transferase AbiEii toxin, Type IV TA system